MFCFNDYVKYIGLTIILLFVIKYLMPTMGFIEALILSIVLITVFIVLINSKNICKKKLERFVNDSTNQLNQPNQPNNQYNQLNNQLNNQSNNQLNNQSNQSNQSNNKPKTTYNQHINDRYEYASDVPYELLDTEAIEQIKTREANAMAKIVSKYQDNMIYTESHPFNTVPLGSKLYGYTYLPPENWYRPNDYQKTTYLHKSVVVPTNSDITDNLLTIDHTAVVPKFNNR